MFGVIWQYLNRNYKKSRFGNGAAFQIIMDMLSETVGNPELTA